MGRRASLLPLAAPAVLLLVAILQPLAVQTRGLSPWKGGGFGMFSTVDAPSARFIRMHLIDAGGSEVSVEPPADLHRDVRRTRTAPSAQSVKALARAAARARWGWSATYSAPDYFQAYRRDTAWITGLPAPLAKPAPLSRRAVALRRSTSGRGAPMAALEPVRFESVRVQLWRYRFDGRRRLLRADLLLEATARRPSEGGS